MTRAGIRSRDFEAYMNSTGVMLAHVDVVEIDTPVTELKEYSGCSFQHS